MQTEYTQALSHALSGETELRQALQQAIWKAESRLGDIIHLAANGGIEGKALVDALLRVRDALEGEE